jgi:predicted nucleic acid-binding protein
MPEVIANTSPLQYLFQLGLLHLLPDLYGEVSVPVSVVNEVRSGLAHGVALPDLDSLRWLRICKPRNAAVFEKS